MATQVSLLLSFGALLKRQRRTAGLTQEQLAERSGFSVSYISMLERGGRTPNASTAEILVAALEPDDAERAALFAALQRAVATNIEAALAREQSSGQHASEPDLPLGGFLGARPDGPLVAREGELRVALAALDTVLAGTGRLVLLAGEPGIGKTRLAQEVALRAQERGALVAVGRCYEPHATTAFYPLSEALATLRASAPAAIGEQMAQRWPDVRTLLPDALPSATLVATSSSLAPSRDDRQRLFWQVADFVRTVAEAQPVAWLLDDLHWADEASLDCLRHLARHTRGARVLLLGTYRDVEMRHQPALRATLLDLVRERLVERVTLRHLEEEGTAAFVAATLGALAPGAVAEDLAEAVGRVTEGHPFFAQEVLRALVERGDVVCEAGRWRQRAAGDLPGDVVVPESVRDTIEARVARLSPLAQTALQEASVLGQTFTFDALRRMGGHTAHEVESALEEALAAALIREAAGEGTDQTYGFNHALTQRAIYVGIPAPRRRRLHRAAGEALEGLREHERRRRAGELAWHFQQGDDIERALPYSLLAGEEAERVYASAEAARHYRLASELAREVGDQSREADALLREGRMLIVVAPAGEARAALERAAELCRAQGDLNGLVQATAVLVRWVGEDGRQAFARVVALLQWLAGDLEPRAAAVRERRSGGITMRRPVSAESYLDQGEALKRLAARATRRLAPRTAAQIEIALASLLNDLLRHTEMVAAAKRASAHARAADDPSLLAQAHQFHAQGLAILGHVETAITIHEAVIQMAERAGDLRTLWLDLTNLGGLLINLGQFARAAPMCQRALQVAERIRDPLAMMYVYANLIELAFFRGEWNEARASAEQLAAFDQTDQPSLLRQFWRGLLALVSGRAAEERGASAAALEQFVSSTDNQLQDYACWALAEYHLVEGRPQRAQALLEPLLAQYHQDQAIAPRNLSLLGWAYLDLAQEQRADEVIAQTLAQTARQQTRLFRVDALRVRALIALRAGRLDDAQAALDEALALCRALPCPYAEAKTLAVYGQLHQTRGEAEPARERYEQALAILGQLGERLYAEHIERALAAMVPAVSARDASSPSPLA